MQLSTPKQPAEKRNWARQHPLACSSIWKESFSKVGRVGREAKPRKDQLPSRSRASSQEALALAWSWRARAPVQSVGLPAKRGSALRPQDKHPKLCREEVPCHPFFSPSLQAGVAPESPGSSKRPPEVGGGRGFPAGDYGASQDSDLRLAGRGRNQRVVLASAPAALPSATSPERGDAGIRRCRWRGRRGAAVRHALGTLAREGGVAGGFGEGRPVPR